MKNDIEKAGCSRRCQAAVRQVDGLVHRADIPFLESNGSTLKASARADKSIRALRVVLRKQMHKALALEETATEADGYLYDELVQTILEIHLKLANCETLRWLDSDALNQEIATTRGLLKYSVEKINWLSDALALASRQNKRSRQGGCWTRMVRFLIERGHGREHSLHAAGDW